MSKNLCFALAAIALSACAATPISSRTSLSAPEGYKLVWADEFDVDGLPNPAKWNYDTYRNKDGWWNEEAQYYSESRPQNARIENGHLIIEAHEDSDTLTEFTDYGGQDYSSARLFTKGKASWTYGYFEIRAKLPCGRGLWPAIRTSLKTRENGRIAGKSTLWNMSAMIPKGFTPRYIPVNIITF